MLTYSHSSATEAWCLCGDLLRFNICLSFRVTLYISLSDWQAYQLQQIIYVVALLRRNSIMANVVPSGIRLMLHSNQLPHPLSPWPIPFVLFKFNNLVAKQHPAISNARVCNSPKKDIGDLYSLHNIEHTGISTYERPSIRIVIVHYDLQMKADSIMAFAHWQYLMIMIATIFKWRHKGQLHKDTLPSKSFHWPFGYGQPPDCFLCMR